MKNILAIVALLSAVLSVLPVQAEVQRGVVFARADADKNASLDRKEFRQFINLLAKAGHRNAKRVRAFRLYSLAWSRVDRNGDGVATRDELSNASMSFNAEKKSLKVSLHQN